VIPMGFLSYAETRNYKLPYRAKYLYKG